MSSAIGTLCKDLDYSFNDPELLEDALSHRSFRGNKNNERLEYLGDAALNFVIAAALFRQNAQAKEGELSRLRANLVRGETLTDLAQEFRLGQYLHLGAGEVKTGGAQRKSILADAMEAIIGAIYLDGGFAACERCILRWYKTRLNRLPLPVYTVLSLEGPAHQQLFKVECRLVGLENKTAMGLGHSRRRAEQEAAEAILKQLELTKPNS
ncbi:ribonuclease III family protein [Rickettsiella massiliensis]|uniref:ribonuclease III family protein n=1 Tax=Rickettsiella massiliensis TaxID=676517 RepID=UPI00029A8E35|nr:ribonuclease III family protein [Rickettsiella massiliensis]